MDSNILFDKFFVVLSTILTLYLYTYIFVEMLFLCQGSVNISDKESTEVFYSAQSESKKLVPLPGAWSNPVVQPRISLYVTIMIDQGPDFQSETGTAIFCTPKITKMRGFCDFEGTKNGTSGP